MCAIIWNKNMAKSAQRDQSFLSLMSSGIYKDKDKTTLKTYYTFMAAVR